MRQAWQRISPLSPDTAAPRPQLYIFPHAGGSRFSYASLAKKLHGFCDVFSTEYPNLELPQIAKWLAQEYFENKAPKSFFMGHSMGALVAYETLLAIQNPDSMPQALLVSACASPDSPHGPPGFQDSSGEFQEQDLLAFMKAYGVLPKIFEHKEARAYFFALLAKDLKLLKKYQATKGCIVIPIHALYGEDDLVVQRAHLLGWQAYAQKEFALQSIAGGHLYPLEQAELLASYLKSFMSAGN